MSWSSRARGVIVACLLMIQPPAVHLLAAQSPVVRFDQAKGVFLLEGWPALSQQKPEQLADMFTVSIDKPDVPPLLGRHSVVNGALVFTPQFGIQDGVRYKAVARIPGMAPISIVADVPKRVIQPSTVVANVFPSVSTLPENQLKFYIHFSASMSQGDAFDHVQLLNEAGVPIPDPPFLPRGGELWDRDFKRFTLFFDPGRVKRDLGPSLAMGPALQEGKRYTLVIDRGWVDANGVPMKEDFRKTFSVGPPDRKALDLATWKIIAPKSGSMEPVAVEFSEPMDHAITLRELDVLDASGKAIEGAVALDRDETRWRLTPSTPWKKGAYTLQVGEVTADLAGNMVSKPFEVDLFEKVDERIQRQTHDIPFKIE
jgi:hypothetical protein